MPPAADIRVPVLPFQATWTRMSAAGNNGLHLQQRFFKPINAQKNNFELKFDFILGLTNIRKHFLLFTSNPKIMKFKISLLLLAFMMLLFNGTSFAQKKYSGKSHSSSHGGSYSGGKGSSHKGGSYKNKSTNNHYGKHKK